MVILERVILGARRRGDGIQRWIPSLRSRMTEPKNYSTYC